MTMNLDEKRERLENYCNDRYDCVSCPSKDTPDIDCYDFFECSDDVIEKAFNLVFGGESKKITNFDTMVNPVQREEINHPDRYAGGKFECIDVMVDVFGADAVKHFCILNAFKYVWRAEKKNGIEDIKKAVWYLNKYIELGGDENA